MLAREKWESAAISSQDLGAIASNFDETPWCRGYLHSYFDETMGVFELIGHSECNVSARALCIAVNPIRIGPRVAVSRSVLAMADCIQYSPHGLMGVHIYINELAG